MSKTTRVSCNDCYFRRTGLCALPGNTPCPTYRAASADPLAPPRQPKLVLLPAGALAAGSVTA